MRSIVELGAEVAAAGRERAVAGLAALRRPWLLACGTGRGGSLRAAWASELML
jgi:hypothetical protein